MAISLLPTGMPSTNSKNLLALNKKKFPAEVLDPTEDDLSLEGSMAAATDPNTFKSNNFYQTPKEESRYVQGRLIMLATELDLSTSLRDNLVNWLGETFRERMNKHSSRKQQQTTLLKEVEESHRDELKAIRKNLEEAGTPSAEAEPDGSTPQFLQVQDETPSNIEITLKYSTNAVPVKKTPTPPSISISV